MITRSKSCLVTVAALILLGLAQEPRARAASRTVSVGVGQSINVRTPRRIAGQVHVINPRVADVVRLYPKGATIVGVSGGTTEIHFTLSNGRVFRVRVRVSKQQVSELLQAVKDFLGPVEGVYPRMFGDKVIIDGRALTAADYGRVMRAVQMFGKKKVINFAGYQPSAVAEINKSLEAAGLNTVRANLYGGMVYLEGAVGSKTEAAKVASLIKSLNLQVVNLLTVGKGRQVVISVKFVELKEGANIKFGLQLPSAISAQGSIQGTIPIYPNTGPEVQVTLTAPEQSMSAQVNLLFQRGYARLLAQPDLVCGSGGNARFLSGGEIPIVQCNINGCQVQYKEYGVKLKVQPIADSRGFVTAKLYAEVSAPDWSNAVKGYPAFEKRYVDTTVTMQEGSTLILSGLYRNKGAKTVNKIPLLGHIPILGELFKSREFLRERSQLAVFITPRIVNPQHPWVRRTIRSVERRYHRFKRRVEWEIFD